MKVEGEVSVRAPRAAVWAAITDVENAAKLVRGIESIEVVDRPATGLLGLQWRETRMYRGKLATVEKRITRVEERVSFTARAESDGFAFESVTSIEERPALGAGEVGLRTVHDSRPLTFGRRLMMPMLFLFRGAIRKALLEDLADLKAAAEASAVQRA